jgi:hypothetical protein
MTNDTCNTVKPCTDGASDTPEVSRIDRHIKAFESIIFNLTNKCKNVSIGGTFALDLHGIYLPRTPADLDMIVYQVTQDQYLYLKGMDWARVNSEGNDMKEGERDYPNNGCISFKFRRFGMYLNILLDKAPMHPGNTLKYAFYDNGHVTYFPINSVKEVVLQKGHMVDKNGYVRAKDATDFLFYKNLNFNY